MNQAGRHEQIQQHSGNDWQYAGRTQDVCGIPYRSVDLDSVEYQKNNLGGQIRAALSAQTGSKTIPQIFIGGEFIGGCTEAFDAFRAGGLQAMLKDNDVSFNEGVDTDPYTFLPQWLHPR